MKYLSCLLVVILSLSQALGQKEKNLKWSLLSNIKEWSEGSILLTDDSEIRGLVKYNDREGILSYHDGENTRVFGPRSVVGFEFFDESVQHQRVFYTLDWGDNDAKRHQFFEVLREFKTFAVLVNFDRVQTEHKGGGWTAPNPGHGTAYGTPGGYNPGRTIISQTETVYIMGTDGQVVPYFENTVEQNGKRSVFTGKDDKVTTEVIDRDLLEKYTGPELYAKMKAYAKENDLKFKTREDLLKILDNYKDLLKK